MGNAVFRIWSRWLWPGIAVGALAACGAGTANEGPRDAAPSQDASALVDAAWTPDAAPPVDAAPASDAAPPDAGPQDLVLAEQTGCFFTVTDVNAHWETTVGAQGTAYAWITIAYSAIHGGWRTDLYDRTVLNHVLQGLSRNVAAFPGRYILGTGAQIHPAAANLDRTSLFFGRVDLEEKPPGLGYTGYTTWRSSFPWQPGERYRFEVTLDAVGQQQRLLLSHGGQLVLTEIGDIPYFDPSLTTSTFTLDFGGAESDGRDVKPLSWQFCDLRVTAEEL